jgi:glycosyltransferase involved in cell wall biosynthesis
VRSALAQDYPRLEVIVADDCSTDETERVVQDFADARLRYEPSAHTLGRVANYRRGLYELARGDWVLNLDGDDFLIDPTFVRGAVRAGERFPDVPLVTADYYDCQDPIDMSALEPDSAASADVEYYDGTEYALSLPRPRFRIHHLSTLYRRSEALPIEFYRADIVSSDYESLYRLAIGKRIAHVSARVAVWRRHPMNASRVRDPRQAIENFRLFQGVHDFAVARLGDTRRRDFDRWLVRTVENRYYGNIVKYVRERDFDG